MRQDRIALAAIAVVIPLAMVATIYTGSQPQGQTGTPAKNKLRVVTSFYPLYDFASHIAGNRANVSSLIPPGIEPHEWEPTLNDVRRVGDADILIINGAGF